MTLSIVDVDFHLYIFSNLIHTHIFIHTHILIHTRMLNHRVHMLVLMLMLISILILIPTLIIAFRPYLISLRAIISTRM